MNSVKIKNETKNSVGKNQYRWIVWGLLAVVYAVVFFHRLAIGVIREELMNEFNLNSLTFANIGAMYFYVYMFMQIPAGILVDLYGARKLVAAGALVSGIGSIVFAAAPNISIIFIGRFLVGLGVSVVFVPILKIQSVWFDEKEFATVTGLTSFIGNLGGVVAQTPLALLVYYFSWRQSFVVIGVFTVVLSIACFFIVKDNPGNKIDISQNSSRDDDKPDMKKAFRNVIFNKNTWPPFMVFALIFGSFVAFSGTWGRTYLIEVYGIEKLNATNFTLAATLGLSFSCVLIGKISDLIKKRKIIVISCMAVNLICWIIVVFGVDMISTTVLLITVALLGSSCSVVVICFTLAKEINHPKYVGISTSVVNMGGFVGAAFIPVIMGNYFDKYSHLYSMKELYQRGFKICVLTLAAGLLISFFIKETNCRNIYDS
jgi:sugar phosphate permease